jgi:hypothetical protein
MRENRWNEAERRAVVKAYLLLGTIEKASQATGVAEGTIKTWRYGNPEWWAETADSITQEMEGQYQSGWRRVLGKAVEQMEDRLSNGDEKLLRDGTKVRVLIAAKEAAVIAGIAADKLRVSMGLPTRITQKADVDRLAKLRKIAEDSRAKAEEAKELPQTVQ